MADMGFAGGPCNWPAGACPADFYGLANAEEAAEVEAEAAFILWSFTGQRYGLCDVTLEMPPECDCSWRCGCRGCVLTLPGPVHEVTEVIVDGVEYLNWVQQGNRLISNDTWPRNVEVTYQRGIEPPAGAARVVSELAKQLALARCNPSKCALPTNLTTRTRQGDTLQVRPQQKKDGRVGLPMIDLWIEAANGVTAPAKVWTPDLEDWVPVTVPASPGSL